MPPRKAEKEQDDMTRKKAGKSIATKSVKDLPAKGLSAKAARSVKGGFGSAEHGATSTPENPKDGVTFPYGGIVISYGSQKRD
jgi:hypothetical protein